MKYFVILVVLIAINNIACAQTETSILPDSSKIYDNRHIEPQNNLSGILKSPYPIQLPVTADIDYHRHKDEALNSDTTKMKALFVRSAFFTGESPLFGKIPIDNSNQISIAINEDFGAYIDTEYRFNMQTLKWEVMPKSDIGTIIKWIKRLVKRKK